MAKKVVSFSFYPDDFAGGTLEFTNAEVGIYIRLLIKQCSTGTISPVSIERVAGESWALIKEKFTQDDSGRWYNPRLRNELEKRESYSKSRSNNRKNISNTYDKHMGIGKGKGKGIVIDKGKGIVKGKGNAGTPPLVFPFTDPSFLTGWQIWKDYKKEQFGFVYKFRGEQAALKMIGDLSELNLTRALKIIERSIGQGWKGFFPLDKKEDRSDYEKAAYKMADDVFKKLYGEQ